MKILSYIKLLVESFGRGIALFATTRNDYIEQVAMPRIAVGRTR